MSKSVTRKKKSTVKKGKTLHKPERHDMDEEEDEYTDTLTWDVPDFMSEKLLFESPEKKGKCGTFHIGMNVDTRGYVSCFASFRDIVEGAMVEWKLEICATSYSSRNITGGGSFREADVREVKGVRMVKSTLGVDRKRSYITSSKQYYMRPDNTIRLQISVFTRFQGEATGFVGLKNQGATCYMNSVLQSLFHLPGFRKIVYDMPTTGTEDAHCIPLNLQRLFCQMQFSKEPVSTKALTKSFGWGDGETIMQHDVQEFCRVLIDNLETKMKGTELESAIADLFKGSTRSYTRCVNVDCERSRIEPFYDLSMVVKGCKSLEESFEKYCEKERMDGDNKIETDDHGKQDADMGVEFVEFPVVLQLHLRRFEYDFDMDEMVKINDRFEFPRTIDLGDYVKGEREGESWIYELFGVLVHSDSAGIGHYYAFLRTSTKPQWIKFDDDWVEKASRAKAMDDNFGGAGTHRYQKKYSGYMLVYVKQSEAARMFEPIPDDMVPAHLAEHVMNYIREKETYRKKKKAEEETLLVQVRDKSQLERSTLMGLPGFRDDESLLETRLHRDTTLHELYLEVSKQLNIPVDEIRLWKTNGQHHPLSVLTMHQSATIKTAGNRYYDLSVFLQRKEKEDELVVPKDTVVLYVKFFFPNAEAKIQFVDSVEINGRLHVSDVVDILNEKLGFPFDTEMWAFMEMTGGKTSPLVMSRRVSDIGTGSIVIFQLPPEVKLRSTFKLKAPVEKIPVEADAEESTGPQGVVITADSILPVLEESLDVFIDKRDNQIDADIYNYDDPAEILFTLRFTRTMPVARFKVLLAAAAKLKFDPNTDSIQLYQKDYQKDCPRHDPVSVRTTVSNIIGYAKHPRLYMQLIEGVSELQLETMSVYNVHMSSNGVTVDHKLRILARKRITCKDLTDLVKERLKLDCVGPYRYYMTYDRHSYGKHMNQEAIVEQAYYPIRIDVIPEDQRELASREFLIEVRQFVPTAYYRTPVADCFYFRVIPGEVFSATKQRICAFLAEDRQKEFDDITYEVEVWGSYNQSTKTALRDEDVFSEKAQPSGHLSLIYKKAHKGSTSAASNASVKIFN